MPPPEELVASAAFQKLPFIFSRGGNQAKASGCHLSGGRGQTLGSKGQGYPGAQSRCWENQGQEGHPECGKAAVLNRDACSSTRSCHRWHT